MLGAYCFATVCDNLQTCSFSSPANVGILFGNVLLDPDALTSDAIPSADIDRFLGWR